MFWLFLSFSVSFFFHGFLAAGSDSLTDFRTTWFGPSYQPANWTDISWGLRIENFEYNAPYSWPEKYPNCGGYNQSPINIETGSLKKRRTRKPLQWANYSKVPKKMVLENSKHSIHMKGEWKNRREAPFITGGVLVHRYCFSQLHFHWGKNDYSGSEHLVNGNSFPLEMHVVHDRDPEEWLEEDSTSRLVVVAFMFEIVRKDNPEISPVLEGIKEVQGNVQKKTNIKPLALDNLLDMFKGDYVSYKGSLTTPPCTENVIWIIASRPLGISRRQLAILRNSVTDEYGRAFSNNRPVQNVNSRNVYYVYR